MYRYTGNTTNTRQTAQTAMASQTHPHEHRQHHQPQTDSTDSDNLSYTHLYIHIPQATPDRHHRQSIKGSHLQSLYTAIFTNPSNPRQTVPTVKASHTHPSIYIGNTTNPTQTVPTVITSHTHTYLHKPPATPDRHHRQSWPLMNTPMYTVTPSNPSQTAPTVRHTYSLYAGTTTNPSNPT